MHRRLRNTILLCVLLFCSSRGFAYSVLTHEAIIDANWDRVIVPLLKQKFPDASPDDLTGARAYAYGGAVTPDMGYYPGCKRLFTDLLHYVRSGDFVTALFVNAQTLNEYAFALGMLSHYEGDRYGHSGGTNVCVPLMYPAMRKKFGDWVTYDDNHLSHVRTEFSFDVLQTAEGTYLSTARHNYVGFQVARSLLEKTFLQIYGLDLNVLFGNFSKGIGMFRWTVVNIVPEITKAAWQTYRREIRRRIPGSSARSFIYRIHPRKYAQEFPDDYKRPGILAHVIAIFLHLAPKIGPLEWLQLKIPEPAEEELFENSFNVTCSQYGIAANALSTGDTLQNIDFDTGFKTKAGEYGCCDKTYETWLIKLNEKGLTGIDPAVRENILSFYANSQPKGNTEKQRKVIAILEKLKQG